MSRDLKDLVPEFYPLACAIVRRAENECGPGIKCIVTMTLRSSVEQAALYAQGRTLPGRIVTNAPPGTSYHEVRRAFDVLLLRGGKVIDDIRDPAWQKFGSIVDEEEPCCWGGHWKNADGPHVEYHPGASCHDANKFIIQHPPETT